MGTTYYVDPAGSNTAPYDTWAKAAQSLATITALAVAGGDVIYARGTETLAAEVNLGTSGSVTSYVRLVGCNALGNVDGTRFTLNCNGAGIFGLDTNGKTHWQIENIAVTNTGAGGVDGFYSSAPNSYGVRFINCCANTCGRYGFNATNFTYGTFFRCVAYSNTSSGFYLNNAVRLFLCCSRDNTGDGYEAGNNDPMIGCVAYDNGDDGIVMTGVYSLIFNCVVDGNTDDGILLSGNDVVIIGSRITNHAGAGDIGLNGGGFGFFTGYNYFENNDGDNIQNAAGHRFLPLDAGGGTSNEEDQSDTNQGYVSLTEGSEDYSTRYGSATDPHLRRTAITIPTS